MKTETQYGIFYKSRGKWIGPYLGELITKSDIWWDSGVDEDNDLSENTPMLPHMEGYLKGVRKQIKKPVKLCAQRIIWNNILPLK